MRFANRYRIESARLPSWDYHACGLYFLTFGTRDRAPLLGTLTEEGVRPSRLGRLTRDAFRLAQSRHPGVTVEACVVMPDHVHALIELGAGCRCRLGNVVGRVKQHVTCAESSAPRPLWQERFYDQIIRDERHREAVRAYIRDNPARAWARRIFHPPPP